MILTSITFLSSKSIQRRTAMNGFLYLWIFCVSCLVLPALHSNTPFCYSQYWSTVDEIVQHMTLEQKIGHMTLVSLQMLYTQERVFTPSLITKYHLGAVFNAASEAPDGQGGTVDSLFSASSFAHATMENYQKLTARLKEERVEICWKTSGKEHKVAIPILLGTDSVHGNQHILGSVLFPHNIGLAATHNPQLVFALAYLTAKETLKSGCNWIFSPTTNMAFNYQWGRTYETMGTDPEAVIANGEAFVQGLQLADIRKGAIAGVLATGKHFFGLGGTMEGADEGNVSTSQHIGFIKTCLPEVLGPLMASAGSIMCAYNAIDNIPMSINELFLNQMLKQGMHTDIPYDGFVVSDYEGISKAASQGLPTTSERIPYEVSVKRALESGMDMFMISPHGPHKTIEGFQNIVKSLVLNGQVPISRIDDAVRRILAVKYAMGLIQKQPPLEEWVQNARPIFPDSLIEKADFEVALQAAQESLVLLKNEQNLLPVDPKNLKYIVLLGQRLLSVQVNDAGARELRLFQDFNNIGAQNGGWSVSWQGFEGNDFWQGSLKEEAHASSLLDGLKIQLAQYPQVELLYPHYTSFTDPALIVKESEDFFEMLKKIPDFSPENTLLITTLAESPYAEFMGDVNISYCQNNDSDCRNGCMYNLHQNAYTPKQQQESLAIHWDAFAENVIRMFRKKNKAFNLVSILLSGRPMVITEPSKDKELSAPLLASDAFIAAWLPGTAGGEALASAIFGSYLFRNKDEANTLPVDWIKSMEQLKNFPVFETDVLPRIKDPLFPMGYGLATT
jgi:beta-glucosidase